MTDNTQDTSHIDAFEARVAASTFRGTASPQAGASDDFVGRTDPGDMVGQVLSQIASIEKRLGETNGFDPATGDVRFWISPGTPTRNALEVQLNQLKNHTLPYTEIAAAEIAARQAAMPSPAQLLEAEQSRQQRIQQAAERRAEEIEVEEAAKRILRARRAVGSP